MRGSFDDLARSLATPMPRRRAMRTIGAAFAVAAFPALRPGRAIGGAAHQQGATGNAKRCFVTIPFGTHEGGSYYPEYQKCCTGPNNDKEHPNQMSWVCPKDYSCGSAASSFCPCPKKCSDGTCCPSTKGRCVAGTCCPAIRTTFRPGSSGKAAACCPPGTIAVPGGVGLCCPKGKPNCCEEVDRRAGDVETAALGPPKGRLCVNGKLRKT